MCDGQRETQVGQGEMGRVGGPASSARTGDAGRTATLVPGRLRCAVERAGADDPFPVACDRTRRRGRARPIGA